MVEGIGHHIPIITHEGALGMLALVGSNRKEILGVGEMSTTMVLIDFDMVWMVLRRIVFSSLFFFFFFLLLVLHFSNISLPLFSIPPYQ